MRKTSTRLTSLIVALSLIVAVSLTGCASGPPAIGELRQVDGGIQVTVPALWVDFSTGNSGVELTTVWAGHTGDSAFSVQLADLAAKGAGSAWQAASASAAAVGTLMSGTDPIDLSFNFSVSGPIDGPSAGGILAIGALSALKQIPLKKNVTMTGTISPDGSLGMVGGIAAKMKAAAEAGYTTVVLPAAAATIPPETSGEPINTSDYGQKLGLQVVLVDNISQAFEVFTDTSLLGDVVSAPTAAPDAQFEQANKKATRAELDAATTAFATVSPDDPALAVMQSELDVAEQTYSSGQYDLAFGVAVDVLNTATRANAGVAMQSNIVSKGLAGARTEFLDTLAVQIKNIDSQNTEVASRVGSMTASQVTLLPSAMTWLSYGRSVLIALSDRLENSPAEGQDAQDELVVAAQIAAEQVTGIDVTFAQNLTMLGASGADPVTPEENPLDHLSAYSSFLISAGQANQQYLTDVFGVDFTVPETFDVTNLVPVVAELSSELQQSSSTTDESTREVILASQALSYYATVSTLSSTAQALGVEGFSLAPDASVNSPSGIKTALATGAENVYRTAQSIWDKGLQPEFGVWSTTWGMAAFNELSQLNRTNAGAVIAINEIWFDSVALYMLNALATPVGQ